MKRYLKLAFFYLKLRLVARLRKRFLIKVLQNQDAGLSSQLAKAGISVKSWLQDTLKNPTLYFTPVDGALENLKDRTPQCVKATITAADRVLQHEFDLLGSGPYIPADPDRDAGSDKYGSGKYGPGKYGHDGYRPIDWYLDPVSGLRFPQGILYTDWKLYKMRPGTADIKLPWELARCQHWAVLGQAYQLTHDEKYAIEIARQLDDFMHANPMGIGINWTCTMDVALRAANWALGLELIRTSKSLDDDFWLRAYDALYGHGLFIRNNLENVAEVISNHYLSNIVGLFYLSAVFRSLPDGQEWQKFCRKSLEEEIENQVLDDGADFESSIPYHRLVAELFLGAARLADVSGNTLSESYQTRLNKMMDYLLGVLRPDGLMPQCGDADDGRLHILTDYGSWNPQDPRHVLAPAGHMLGRSDLLNHVGTEGLWEAAWWGIDPTELEVSAISPPPPLPMVSRLFPQAGHAVFREDGSYLLITNSVVGSNGVGNHKHNDQLAFEFHAFGIPFFVDAGSHVYTSDRESRNLFRGTGYHNTLKIDGTEQNEMNPEWFFRMFDSGTPEHLSFSNENGSVTYHGRHIGYRRLNQPVIHERYFRLLKGENVLFIADVIKGNGQHKLEWHYHCAPGIEVTDDEGGTVWLDAQDKRLGIVSLDHIPSVPGMGWYSPSYGKKLSCSVVDYYAEETLNGSTTRTFVVAPATWLASTEGVEAMGAFREEMGR